MSCRQSPLLARSTSLHLINIIFLLYPHNKTPLLLSFCHDWPSCAGWCRWYWSQNSSCTVNLIVERLPVIQGSDTAVCSIKNLESHTKSLGKAGLSGLLCPRTATSLRDLQISLSGSSLGVLSHFYVVHCDTLPFIPFVVGWPWS